jgi:hypothetical protein
MASVFHYTDASGLLGILGSESLFATDYRYLNDVAEKGIIRELLMPILESEVAEITPKLIQKGWLDKTFYEQRGLSAHGVEAESMYRSIMTGTDNVSPLFVLSFCRHDEGSHAFAHGLLSQWRGYAGSGGFAIEFDEQQIGSLIGAEGEEYAHVLLRSADVLYEKYETLFDKDLYKGVAGELTRMIFEEAGIDISEVSGRKDVDAIIPNIIATAPFLKHWGFSEEKEYRIIASCVRKGKIPEGEHRRPKRIETRIRKELIVPYIELFDRTDIHPAIKSVIIGPHPEQDKQAKAVSMAMETEGFDIPIKLSEIPYRT